MSDRVNGDIEMTRSKTVIEMNRQKRERAARQLPSAVQARHERNMGLALIAISLVGLVALIAAVVTSAPV